MTRKRIVQFLILIAGLFVFLYMARQWPKDRTFHFVLGDAAPRIDELSVRYDDAHAKAGDPLRFATFRYGAGAPRIVTHETRLADGDYTVEIEVASRSGPRPGEAGDVPSKSSLTTVRRNVTIDGPGTTTIDLSRDLAKAKDEAVAR